jgi:hypothetical protein
MTIRAASGWHRLRCAGSASACASSRDSQPQGQLTIFANVLAQISEVMALAATEPAPAIEQEQAATLSYIAALEARLSEQRTLS